MSVPSDGPTQLLVLSRALGLADLEGLANPDLGTLVRRARTSWVVRVNHDGKEIYIKTYDYPRVADRLRGALRNTGPLTPSRARCEARASQWLQQHGFAFARVVGVAEFRQFGFLRRAILVTEAFAGRRVDDVLSTADSGLRAALGAAIGTFVRTLHHQGFRDRNLDLRNLLLADDAGCLRLCKIDSPRHRLVRPGPPTDRLAAADWARLLPQLKAFGIDGLALRAAAEPS